MSNPESFSRLRARRRLLKSVALGGGLATTLKSVPEVWSRPIIGSIVLPAHAETTTNFTCSIPFNFTFSASKTSSGLFGTYQGTQFAAGPFFGNCASGIQFSDSPLVVEISDEGGGSARVKYIVNGEQIFDERVLTKTAKSPDSQTTGVPQSIFDTQIPVMRDTVFSGLPALEKSTYFLQVVENSNVNLNGSCNGILNAEPVLESDINIKENIETVDRHAVLDKLVNTPISYWNYRADHPSVRHIGPMAQDFAGQFEVGTDDKSIHIVDGQGVTMASIQALYELLQQKDRQIAQMQQQMDRFEKAFEGDSSS